MSCVVPSVVHVVLRTYSKIFELDRFEARGHQQTWPPKGHPKKGPFWTEATSCKAGASTFLSGSPGWVRP